MQQKFYICKDNSNWSITIFFYKGIWFDGKVEALILRTVVIRTVVDLIRIIGILNQIDELQNITFLEF